MWGPTLRDVGKVQMVNSRAVTVLADRLGGAYSPHTVASEPHSPDSSVLVISSGHVLSVLGDSG